MENVSSRASRFSTGPASDVGEDDLELTRFARANVLVLGNAESLDGAVGTLMSAVRAPVAYWRSSERLPFPALPNGGTLILPEVSTLTIADQQRLMEWLDGRTAHTQVVSTTTVRLLPRIRSGDFLEALYYRLNVVFVDLTA
jgi:transcriptional regulator of aromatic amino acid metabolism